MKTAQWLGLLALVTVSWLLGGCAHTQPTTVVAAPPPGPPAASVGPAATANPPVSPAAAEVVRLAEAGTSDDVIVAYVQDSSAPFALTADQILYLRDIGVSSPVITAMLSRDATLRSQGITAPVAPAPAPVAVEAPLVPQTPAEYVSSPPPEVSYFYDELSPYGTWVQLDGAGWCWQPRAVVLDHGWRPYCDSGHWVYTDVGWFWQSDYSWGWAPFHYGRWWLDARCGWVWAPDRVWGPAWVTWRYEGDHCGWAPLPPHADFDMRLGYRFNGAPVAATFDFGLAPAHFTFVALKDFQSHDFAHHRMSSVEVTRIYNRTTVINNYEVRNNVVINTGIKVDRVTAATHAPIHPVALREVSSRSAALAASRGPARTELAVYRPPLRPAARTEHMVAQKVDQRHPIQHGAALAFDSRRSTPGNSAPGPGYGVAQRPASSARASYPTPKALAQGPAKTVRPAPSTTPARSYQSLPTTNPRSNDGSRWRSVPQTAAPARGQYYPKEYDQSSSAGHAPRQQPNARPANSRGQSFHNSRSEKPGSSQGGKNNER